MLILPENLLFDLHAHAAEGYPYEIVGVLAGAWEAGDVKRVSRLFRGTNQFRLAEAAHNHSAQRDLKSGLELEESDSSANRYFMTAEEMRAIDAECRAVGIDILGFYHTHPDHPALPSVTDLRFAQQTLPGYSYVITSVESGQPVKTTCWVLSDDESRFVEEEIRRGA